MKHEPIQSEEYLNNNVKQTECPRESDIEQIEKGSRRKFIEEGTSAIKSKVDSVASD